MVSDFSHCSVLFDKPTVVAPLHRRFVRLKIEIERQNNTPNRLKLPIEF
jgi:hypothetical protein